MFSTFLGAEVLIPYQSGAQGKKKNVLLFWKTTSKSPKQNKQMKRNMTDCKETCWTVSFRFLTLAHHIYLDTCPLSILDTFSTHTLAARLQGSPASMPGQVCAVVPGPCGAQMHSTVSCPCAQAACWGGSCQPCSPSRVVTASTQLPCHQNSSAHIDLWLRAA